MFFEVPLKIFHGHNKGSCKQLLDEVFVIFRIIKVEVGVMYRSRRLRLITLTDNCFIIH